MGRIQKLKTGLFWTAVLGIGLASSSSFAQLIGGTLANPMLAPPPGKPLRFVWDENRYSFEELIDKYLDFKLGLEGIYLGAEPPKIEIGLVIGTWPTQEREYHPDAATLFALLLYRYPAFRDPRITVQVSRIHHFQYDPVKKQTTSEKQSVFRDLDVFFAHDYRLRAPFDEGILEADTTLENQWIRRRRNALGDPELNAIQSLREGIPTSHSQTFKGRVHTTIEKVWKRVKFEARPSQIVGLNEILFKLDDALEASCNDLLGPKALKSKTWQNVPKWWAVQGSNLRPVD